MGGVGLMVGVYCLTLEVSGSNPEGTKICLFGIAVRSDAEGIQIGINKINSDNSQVSESCPKQEVVRFARFSCRAVVQR